MKILKDKRFIISLVVIALIVFAIIANRDHGSKYEIAEAKRGAIMQEVSVTGRVKPAEEVNLAFEISGRVARVNFEVGDAVGAGSLLVSLDSTGLAAELAKAESDLMAQTAKLTEEKITLQNLYSGSLNVLNDAYLKADDAVRAKVTGMFSGSKTSSYSLTFSTCDETARVNSISGKLSAEIELDKWKSELNLLSESFSMPERDRALVAGRSHLLVITAFLENLSKALNVDCLLNQSSLDAYRTNLNTARTNVQTALTAISDKEQAIALERAVISSTEAFEKSYAAAVENIKADIAKTRLYSPIRGVVTAMEAKTGEFASAGEIVASVISASRFEMEADVPEADVAKIKIGDEAKVTLDAYGNEIIFGAIVSKIDPAERFIEGVPTYRTKLQFKEQDERIKSGMTANIDILVAEKMDVIHIPARAVRTEGGRNYVRILDLDGKTPREMDVQIGLRGSDGNMEIISGLKEGDKVIVFEK
ncbi:MAG TPA: efflux RND transporter periplasmic adaptor subunit [Candidatus Paceibacterota bacterium]|nr:efflux RND transporter periplasmic adaptor subunit [Candidatus Paceibacterota bacterium]